MGFFEALNLGWVGSLIGLISLIVAFILYRASRVRPQLVYQYKTLRLLWRKEQALPEDVVNLYRDKKVERLTKTHIILWNSGNATVNGENIVADDPLRFEFGESGEVLSASVVRFTRESSKFAVDINPHSPNEVIFRFDYLDAGDGAVVELLHTAEEARPTVNGSIRGIPKGILNRGRILPSAQEIGFSYRTKPVSAKAFKFYLLYFEIMIFFMALFAVYLFACGFLQTIIPESFIPLINWPRWLLFLLGVIFTLASLGGWHSLYVTQRRFPKSLSIQDIEW